MTTDCGEGTIQKRPSFDRIENPVARCGITLLAKEPWKQPLADGRLGNSDVRRFADAPQPGGSVEEPVREPGAPRLQTRWLETRQECPDQ